MKNLFKNYFMSLVNFILSILMPEIIKWNTDKYFEMSKKELRATMIPHIVVLTIALGCSLLLNVIGMPEFLAFVLMLPITIAVIFTIADSIAIMQVMVTNLHGKPEEYVDPETGVSRTLMTYEKKRFI